MRGGRARPRPGPLRRKREAFVGRERERRKAPPLAARMFRPAAVPSSDVEFFVKPRQFSSSFVNSCQVLSSRVKGLSRSSPGRIERHQGLATRRGRPSRADWPFRGFPRIPPRSRGTGTGRADACRARSSTFATAFAAIGNRRKRRLTRFPIRRKKLSRARLPTPARTKRPPPFAAKRSTANCDGRGKRRRGENREICSCPVWTAPLVEGFLAAWRTSRVRSCLRPVYAGLRPAGPDGSSAELFASITVSRS
jgi:hypothetical protein